MSGAGQLQTIRRGGSSRQSTGRVADASGEGEDHDRASRPARQSSEFSRVICFAPEGAPLEVVGWPIQVDRQRQRHSTSSS